MHLKARKPIFIPLAILLLTLAVGCTALSISSSQPMLPGAQEGTPEPTSIPEPAATVVSLGSGTRYLSPELWSLLYQQLAGTTVPERVSVLIIENGVPGVARCNGLDTINILHLNDVDMRSPRFDWTREFNAGLLSFPRSERKAFIAMYTRQPVEYAGVTGMLVEQLRRDGRI